MVKEGGANKIKTARDDSNLLCLADAVIVRIEDDKKRASFGLVVIKAKPKKRDTTPGDLTKALADHGMALD